MDSAPVTARVKDVAGGIHVEMVLDPDGEGRVITVTSEGELQAQFAQLARSGWELTRTIEEPDRGDATSRFSLEFEKPRH